MRHWLLRRPPLDGINPAFANRPWDYDKVHVNPRLHPGDVVYLIGAYNDLYGWGHVISKKSYPDHELNRRAYSITVTRPVVQQNLVTAQDVKGSPKLAELFSTDVNLIELHSQHVNLLNGLLAATGVLTPPDKHDDEDQDSTVVERDFPRLKVSEDVRIWISAAYERIKAGKKVEPNEMIVELWEKIPDFNYREIDRRLMQFGVEPTLLGILQIDPDTELFDTTDQVIRFIKRKIQKEPHVQQVTAEEISEALELPEPRVSFVFSLMNQFGQFWNGASGNPTVPGYTSITIEREGVKREYLRYAGLAPLLERFAKPADEDTSSQGTEAEFIHDVLDWKLKERKEEALHWVDRLSSEELLSHDNDRALKAVERFAIAVPKLAEKPIRDEAMPELEDLISDRKTGVTGHVFLVPIDGDAEWFQEVNMQTVASDGHPLGFLDNVRSWIYLKLTVSPDDPDGILKHKLDERMQVLTDYGAHIANRIISFNKELAENLVRDLNKRKNAIQKGRAEAEAMGLATAHNPKHAETAVQIERLMERLGARFTGQANISQTSATEMPNRRTGDNASDLHEDALTIAGYMYNNKFIGSRSITLSELRSKLNLSEQDFDTADEYLLESRVYEGTMGGDAGQRWLTATGVDFVRQGGSPGQRARVIENSRQSAIDVFISHSSKDAPIAKALVLLLKAALNISSGRIRCTSVDGYGLSAGAETDNQLRVELRESKVFLGIITQSSVESTYVLFELGARWGAHLQLAPVLASSADKTLLRGPLSGLNALSCDSRSQVLQLVDDVGSDLGLIAEKAASYQDYVDDLLRLAGAITPQPSQTAPTITVDYDFERMAQHVMNYFSAKGFEKQVGFERLRKNVNEKYSDELLFQMIDRFPARFRRVTLRGGKPAVGLVRTAASSQVT